MRTVGDFRQLRCPSRIEENRTDRRTVPVEETAGHGADAGNGEVAVVDRVVRGVTAEVGSPRDHPRGSTHTAAQMLDPRGTARKRNNDCTRDPDSTACGPEKT